MKPLFSVILPLHKQRDHLEYIITAYKKGLDKLHHEYEVLLIINGPSDGSFSEAMRLTKQKSRFKVFKLNTGGWGKAVNFGIKKANGDFICYNNSARTNISDLVYILKLSRINKNAVVKATRIQRQDVVRSIGSFLFNLTCRLVFQIPIWDINATPKALPREILKNITLRSEDDLIDLELLLNCFRKRIPILEVPTVFNSRISGKSTTNFMSAIKMFRGIIKFKETYG